MATQWYVDGSFLKLVKAYRHVLSVDLQTTPPALGDTLAAYQPDPLVPKYYLTRYGSAQPSVAEIQSAHMTMQRIWDMKIAEPMSMFGQQQTIDKPDVPMISGREWGIARDYFRSHQFNDPGQFSFVMISRSLPGHEANIMDLYAYFVSNGGYDTMAAYFKLFGST